MQHRCVPFEKTSFGSIAIEELGAYPAYLGITGTIGNPMRQAQRMVKTGG
ncbi:hypothetical protein ACDY97_14185 [Rhizobium mongolense]|nr:hypothetical protein [Rhizobium sp. CC1099]WFU89801.1 hypothetical protein QA644_27505 [Rhizobium sp. CC1099]